MAASPHAWSAAPNFAFDLAARKTTDDDLAGLDLGGVLGIISGAERVELATVRRFVDRFAHFNFREDMVRPSYGLAEATVFVATGIWSGSSGTVHFDAGELSSSRARRCAAGQGTALVKYTVPQSPTLRIVDADTHRECPPSLVGEIWVHGDNVAEGYWRKPPEEQCCFGATLVDPAPGTPDAPWLRTGDLGFIFEDALFIVGRIKDLLIIRGRNHYPEDIEATVHEITRGRVAAISVRLQSTEQLVTIIELKKRGDSNEEVMHWLSCVKSDVTSAISHVHGLNVGMSFWCRRDRFPPQRAAKSGVLPVWSSTAATSSSGWTPKPAAGRVGWRADARCGHAGSARPWCRRVLSILGSEDILDPLTGTS